jgi:hypothetical protein
MYDGSIEVPWQIFTLKSRNKLCEQIAQLISDYEYGVTRFFYGRLNKSTFKTMNDLKIALKLGGCNCITVFRWKQ